ncbi:unnamed protein product [Phytophthora lilii]|uniref:Unnamed protein product n=1 Tax=Phytophthora lilii TaxID=2077276 RepID=A0A9W6WWA9_9STRA|nr:unnamed protein product [Phytophthora lilii]
MGSGGAGKRVAFEGAEVIEFDAERPAAARLCGVRGAADLALECRARGLQTPSAEELARQHVQELQSLLRRRGFEPISAELEELQTQRRVVELLLAWAAGVDAAGDKENGRETVDLLDPRTLRRAQLAKKQLEGKVDDGYAFGRRFFSVATYVDTLSSDKLLAVAKDRGVELPKLDDKQRAAVKALDRELLGLYGTAEGRPLRSLTLRQLVTEAEARGILGPGGETARDSKGKKSKRAWVDTLRPVMVAEVRAGKIREQEEELLREKLVQELEREKEKEQQLRVVQLIETVMNRSLKISVNGECAEPEDDDATLGHDNQDSCKKSQQTDKVRRFLEALVKSVCMPSEAQEDVVMKE